MKIENKKIIIIVLYWILYSIRCVLFAPVYFLCIVMSATVYMINLGFVYNVFRHHETYDSWRECREMVIETPGLWITAIFMWLIIPFCIPVFVLRHLYLGCQKIDELYSEIKKS